MKKECVFCGDSFETKLYHQKYCSGRCRRDATNERRQLEIERVRTIDGAGKQISEDVHDFVDGLIERRFDLSPDCIRFFFGARWSKEKLFELFHEMVDRKLIDLERLNSLLFMNSVIRKRPPAISFEEIFKNIKVNVKGK